MEAKEGTAGKSKGTTPLPLPPPVASGSGSGTSASATDEGADKGRPVNVFGPKVDEDAGVSAEARDGVKGEGEEDDALSNDEDDDDDGRSTVSEDGPPLEWWQALRFLEVLQGGVAMEEDSDDSEDDYSDTDTTSGEEDAAAQMGDDKKADDVKVGHPDVNVSDSGPSKILEQSGGEAGELHPMKNPLILTSFFGVCPSHLLSNFRLVCNQWWDLSLEPWRSSFPLNFIDYGGKVALHVDDAAMDYYEDVPLKEFLKHVDDPKNQCLQKPFRRYDLSGQFVFPLEENKSVRVRKLWELVKRDATVLRLSRCSFPKVEVFRKVMYSSCSNLRQLELHCCCIGKKISPMRSFSDYLMPGRKEPFSAGVYPEQVNLKSLLIKMEEMDRFPLTWLELFSQFPSLTRLTLEVFRGKPSNPGFPVYDLLPVLETIQAIRKEDPRKLALKELNVLPYFEIDHDHRLFCEVFTLLRELNLPLQFLKLNMESEEELELHELAGASEIDGRELRHLTFHQAECGISTWKFPLHEPLENLAVLGMTDIVWENMDFLKFTPNLKKLKFIDFGSAYLGEDIKSVSMISNTDKDKMVDVKLLKLKDFSWGYALAEDDLRKLGNWFPNLTRLNTAALNDKLFSIVCEHFRDLESLCVEEGELTDHGVTGLAEGQIVDDLDTMELPPNIRLLQKLAYFTCGKSDKISDVSIFHGFLKLPQLRCLGLSQTKGLTNKGKAAMEMVNKLGFRRC